MTQNLSPYASVARHFHDKGYSIVPLIPGAQVPGQFKDGCWQPLPNWDQFANRKPSDIEIEYWSNLQGGPGVGVVCGPISGIIGLDFDYDVDGLHEVIRQMIPDSPVKKKGSKGYTAFYRYNGERSSSWNKNKQTVLDLLSATGTPDEETGEMVWRGKQTVLPPSLHPLGMTYQWITRKTLLDVNPHELPVLPADFVERLDKLFGKNQPIPKREPITDLQAHEYGECTLADVEKALAYIGPDESYHIWVEVGMAIKTQFGDGGFDLWDSWSSQGSKYKPKEMAAKWRSFRRNDKKIASVFYFAQQAGYVHASPYSALNSAQAITILPGGNLELLLKESPMKKQTANGQEFPQHLIDNAPGLLKPIIDHILITSPFPQPILALGAALTCLGAIKGHKVKLENNFRTNLYIVGAAPSGAGKDHARKCIQTILNEIGESGLIGGAPKSGAGLLNSLSHNQGRRIILWDEFGRMLTIAAKSKGNGYSQEIFPILTELYTTASSIFIGAEYANADGKRPRFDIEAPNLTVYATTVPDNLYSALSGTDVVDGFLARWSIFESTHYALDPQDVDSTIPINPALIESLKAWVQKPTNVNPKGNMDTRINPKTIYFSPEAKGLAHTFCRKMRLLAKEESEQKSGLAAIYARTHEQACKFALIATEGDAIEVSTFQWASELAFYLTEHMISKIQHQISENPFEAEYKKVQKIIHEAGFLTLTQIGQKTRFLSNSKRRQDIIHDLTDSEEIVQYPIKAEESKKAMTYLFCNCGKHPELDKTRKEIELQAEAQTKK